MTSSVLVPLDGSDKDDRALSAAAAMVLLTGHEARLLRVLAPPVAALSDRMATMGGLDAAQTRLAEASLAMGEASARLAKVIGNEPIVEVAEGFDIGQVLVDRAGRGEIAVVVMATRAAVGPDRAFFGSVADHVMRESTRPVLLVPPLAQDRRAKALELRRVLVPLDGTRVEVTALEQLLAMDHFRQLEYVLLEVVPLQAPPHGLDEVMERLRAGHARSVERHVIANEDPAATIIRVARDQNIDFIAMSPRGLHGVDRFVKGSVAECVVRDGHLPVFALTSAGNTSP